MITGASGFDLLDFLIGNPVSDNPIEESTVTAYDAAGHALGSLKAGSFTGQCGLADVAPNGHRMLIAETLTTQPPQGIYPAKYSLSISAWDASSGKQLWNTPLVQPEEEPVGCAGLSGGPAGADFSATSDGKWGVLLSVGPPPSPMNVRVNLTTGAVSSRPDLLGTLGNYLITGSTTGQAIVDDAAAWTPLGSLATSTDGEAISFTGHPDLADSGVVDAGWTPTSPASALSWDGNEIISYQSISNTPLLRAYQLPSGKLLWQQKVDSREFLLMATAGNRLVVGLNGPDGVYRLSGIDPATGAQAWTVPDSKICGVTASQMLIIVNGQYSLIDVSSGHQLSYNGTGSTEDCPTIQGDGLQVSQSEGMTTVTQGMTP